MATPNFAVASPLSLPYLLLPGWLAPAYVKLVEIACAVAGCYLYLRRIRLDRAPALLGGLVFVSTGFMIVWTNWPQTRVAAFIPALFWAVERAVQRRRFTDAVPVALVLASMVLGGFPAVTGYALYTAAGYLLVRVAVEYRHRLRRAAAVLGTCVVGLVLGFALAAWQLVPFAVFMGNAHVAGREQSAINVLPRVTLLTTVAPWALGNDGPDFAKLYYWARTPVVNNNNLIETMAYVGAGALVLAVFAVTRAGYLRGMLPGGVLPFLIVAVLFWIDVCYSAGFPGGLLVHLPVFDSNFVGRARSVLGFLIAVLAAIGLQLAGSTAPRGVPRWRPAIAWGIRAGVLIGLVALWFAGRHLTGHSVVPGDVGQRLATLDRQGLLAAALIGAAVLLVITAQRARPSWRTGALVALPLLVFGQALTVALPYLPRSARSTYYPQTDLTRFLAANLGDDRMATGQAMQSGTETAYRLRALDGHVYADRRMVDLFSAVPGFTAVNNTTLAFQPTAAQMTSPVLDRLGVKYFVAPPEARVVGTAQPAPAATGTVLLRPGQPLRFPVPGDGPLRGVLLTLDGTVPFDARLALTVADPSGRVVGTGGWQLLVRPVNPTGAGTVFATNVPVAGEDIPAGTPLTATLSLAGSAPVQLAALADGTPAVGVVRPAADGLRLVFAGTGAVYQRLNALPRIRWASGAVTVPDGNAQVSALAGGQTPADTVLLSAPGPAADGAPAQLAVTADGAEDIRVRVQAAGAGYLVVADSIQVGWSATVDGRPAAIVPADHAIGAVAVPAGTHTIRLRYTPPAGNVGAAISLVALLLVLLIGTTSGLAPRSLRALRRRLKQGSAGRAPAGDDAHETLPAPGEPVPVGRPGARAVLQRGGPRGHGGGAEHRGP